MKVTWVYMPPQAIAVISVSNVADNEFEYWQDLDDEYNIDSREQWRSQFAVIMAKTSNSTVLGAITIRHEDGVHMRRGATEINDTDA